MKFLVVLNLLGVVALSWLCAAQWQTNRNLNLLVMRLDRTRQEQAKKIAEHEQTIAGCRADLDDFRKRLEQSEQDARETHVQLDQMTSEYDQASDERDRTMAERDQLQAEMKSWVEAVKERDEALKKAHEALHDAAVARNDAIAKFNDLADKYNALVTHSATTKPGGQ